MNLYPPSKLAAWCADADERLRFMLLMAVAVHAIIILVVGFDSLTTQQNTRTLEITIAQSNESDPPDEAAFLAQHNQTGAGKEQVDVEASVTEKAVFKAHTIQTLSAQNPPTRGSNLNRSFTEGDANGLQIKTEGDQPTLTTDQPSAFSESKLAETDTQRAAATFGGDSTSLMNTSREIASLEARLKEEQQQLKSRSRVGRVTSVSTVAQTDALYLERWRERIEAIGNLHYPQEARRNGIEGSLRLLVTLQSDGRVQHLEMLKSSGHPLLDDAALTIVRTASPFEPFPEAMRARIDSLEIIRTWKFAKNTQIY